MPQPRPKPPCAAAPAAIGAADPRPAGAGAAGIVTISAIGLVVNQALVLIERRLSTRRTGTGA